MNSVHYYVRNFMMLLANFRGVDEAAAKNDMIADFREAIISTSSTQLQC